MCIEVEAESHQVGSHDRHFWPVDISAEQDARMGSGKLEAIDRQESGPVCLVDIFAKRGDFTGRSHFFRQQERRFSDIPTPRKGSAPGRRVHENCGTLMAT